MPKGRFVVSRDGSVARADTGEVVESGFVAVHTVRARSEFKSGFVSMSQFGSKNLARDGKELGLDGFRVLHELVGVLDYENLILVSPAEIGRALGMQGTHVCRAIRRLVSFGAVIEGPVLNRRRSYRLNPELGWKGSAANHKRALKDRMASARISVVA